MISDGGLLKSNTLIAIKMMCLLNASLNSVLGQSKLHYRK